MKFLIAVVASLFVNIISGCNSEDSANNSTKGTVEPDSLKKISTEAKNETVRSSPSVLSAVNIHYDVSLIAQPDNCTCWAAASAMVLSYWHNVETNPSNPPYTITQMKAKVTNGCPACDITCGLRPQDAKDGGDALGLSFDQPQCYGVNGFAALLQSKGPLIFIRAAAGASRGAHAIVISGMRGDGSPDGTTVETLNPSPVGQGASQDVSFTQLMQKMEQLGFWDQGDWSAAGGLDRVYVTYKK